MKGLSGLTAIAGYQATIDEESQATAEERLGGTVDPSHGKWDVDRLAYESYSTQAGSHGPYGPDSELLEDFDYWFLMPAGQMSQDPYMDKTPSRRAGPWPKGIATPIPRDYPDDIANQLQQSAAIHAVKTGASRRSQFTSLGDVQQDSWEGFYEYNPGSTNLQPASRQAMSSGFMWGTRDRTQSFAKQNEHGFDTAHMMRRYATGSIPGNNDWMKPGGRIMMKSLPGPARPAVGRDSPFSGHDLGAAFGIDGAILQNVPSEYVPPFQPNLAPSTVSPNYGDSIVEWY